jgi:integrase
MRKPVLKVREYRYNEKHLFMLDLRGFGRGRKFFKTRAAAEDERLRLKEAMEQHGRRAVGLSQRVLAAFLSANDKLAVYGKSITDAADFFIHHLEQIRRCKTTVVELAQEVLDAKSRDGMSDAYLYDLRKRLDRFCQIFGNRPIAGVTVEEIDKWLRDLPLSPKSRLNYRANVGVLFSYAKQRRMISENPIEFTARPKLVDKAPDTFTVDELRALLEAAQSAEPSVVPMLTIGAFAGLRDSEIKRLDWSEVDLARGFVKVAAAKAKSARRRLVPISCNLMEWLRPYGNMTGPVVPDGYRGKLERVRKVAGIDWKHNALRHSFASYRLMATNNAAQVALELGHASSAMLFSNYREIVRPEEAERYWKIAPVTDAVNVVSFNRNESGNLAMES